MGLKLKFIILNGNGSHFDKLLKLIKMYFL